MLWYTAPSGGISGGIHTSTWIHTPNGCEIETLGCESQKRQAFRKTLQVS